MNRQTFRVCRSSSEFSGMTMPGSDAFSMARSKPGCQGASAILRFSKNVSSSRCCMLHSPLHATALRQYEHNAVFMNTCSLAEYGGKTEVVSP